MFNVFGQIYLQYNTKVTLCLKFHVDIEYDFCNVLTCWSHERELSKHETICFGWIRNKYRYVCFFATNLISCFERVNSTFQLFWHPDLDKSLPDDEKPFHIDQILSQCKISIYFKRIKFMEPKMLFFFYFIVQFFPYETLTS